MDWLSPPVPGVTGDPTVIGDEGDPIVIGSPDANMLDFSRSCGKTGGVFSQQAGRSSENRSVSTQHEHIEVFTQNEKRALPAQLGDNKEPTFNLQMCESLLTFTCQFRLLFFHFLQIKIWFCCKNKNLSE